MARRTRNRLMMATLVGAVLLAVGVVAVEGPASSSPKLPPVAPDRLIASVLQAAEGHPPVSGRIVAHVDLGLPQFPDEGGNAPTGPAALVASIAGDHVLRLWRSDGGARLSELLPFSERSITVSKTDAWAWDSSTFTAYHVGPFPAGTSELPATEKPASLVDPLELARKSLAAITPTTLVSVGDTARVAGRNVYTLVLEPRTSATLVGRIEVSVDAAERIPLRVAVFARGARKAIFRIIWAPRKGCSLLSGEHFAVSAVPWRAELWRFGYIVAPYFNFRAPVICCHRSRKLSCRYLRNGESR